MRAAVRLQAANLTVERSRARADGVREFLRELRPLLERVAIVGDQLAPMAADVGQRPEPSSFDAAGARHSVQRRPSNNRTALRCKRLAEHTNRVATI